MYMLLQLSVGLAGNVGEQQLLAGCCRWQDSMLHEENMRGLSLARLIYRVEAPRLS